MNYRRPFAPGGSYFFTVVTEKRKPILSSEEAVDVLRKAFRAVKRKYPFTIEAIVVLPEHMHCVWTLPPGDADFSTRWRLIKTWFTKHANCGPAAQSPARRRKHEQAVWQHRYWEHLLRDEDDFARHIDYIHYNPVKHGHVGCALEWPYSSMRRYVEAGVYPEDWGCACIDFGDVGHE